jgi:hypothetical protein
MALLLPLVTTLILGADDGPGTKIRLLPVDTKTGAVAQGLKPEDFLIKVDGNEVKALALSGPFEGEVGWVLIFQPIRTANHRAAAFLATAELLDRLPSGDKVLFLVRTTKSYQFTAPGFTSNRGEWARMLAELPGLLPEVLMGVADAASSGAGLKPGHQDKPSSAADNQAFSSLLGQIRSAVEKKDPVSFAKGTMEKSTDAGGLDNAVQASSVVVGEMKVLGNLLQKVAGLPGQNQVIVFSRNEADTLSRPEMRNTKWGERTLSGSAAGGNLVTKMDTNWSQDRVNMDMVTTRQELTTTVIATHLPIHSVAGISLHVTGNLGEVAKNSGGYVFPFGNQMVEQIPGVLMSFRNSYTISIPASATPSPKPRKLEIESRRPGLKVYTAKLI